MYLAEKGNECLNDNLKLQFHEVNKMSMLLKRLVEARANTQKNN